MERNALLEKVEHIFEGHGYGCCRYAGCFDIAARNTKASLLVKVSANIDSFQEAQSLHLKIFSSGIEASSMLVGMHTRRDMLEDNIIYSRFGVPSMTPGTLENILASDPPVLYRLKGGLFSEVDPALLKQGREEKGLTQKQLAEKAGVTKKSIYEHESRRMKIDEGTGKNLEMIVEKRLLLPFALRKTAAGHGVRAKGRFEQAVSRDLNKIGFETSFVYQAPANIVASESFPLLANAEKDEAVARKKSHYIKEFSDTVRRTVLFVTKSECSFDLPTLEEKKLREMTTKELRKFVERW